MQNVASLVCLSSSAAFSGRTVALGKEKYAKTYMYKIYRILNLALQYSAAVLSGRVLLVLIPKTGLPPLHTSTFRATWGLDKVILSGLQEQF